MIYYDSKCRETGMLSKNNYQERLRKMDDKQERFSIRKFSVGAASVLVGTAILSMQNVQTDAPMQQLILKKVQLM